MAKNERDARVSIHHSAAVALLFGAAGLAEYSGETTADPSVTEFRSRVTAVLDPGMPQGAARVEIRLKDGRTLATTVLNARGSLEAPLSDDAIASKVRDLARGGSMYGRIDAIIDRIWDLDQLADARAFSVLLAAQH